MVGWVAVGSQEPAGLIMTTSAVEKLLSCSSSWLEVSDELLLVSTESGVGKLIFGWAWQGVRSEKISKTICDELQVLASKRIDDVSFNHFRLRCWEKINAIDQNLSSFMSLRSIVLEYRGVPVWPLVFPAGFMA